MFRALMFLGVLGIAAFLAGWFTVDRNDKETTIRFNRDEIRADASKAFAKGRELLNKSKQAADGSGQSSPSDQFTAQGGQSYGSYQTSGNGAGYNAPPQYGTQTYGNQPYNNAPYQPSGYQNYPAPAGYQAPANGAAPLNAPQQASRPNQPWDQSAPPRPQY